MIRNHINTKNTDPTGYAGSEQEAVAVGVETVAVVPEGVTEIGACAFQESAVKRVVLPASLERIGDCAFYGCDRLEEVVFSVPGNAGLTEVGDSAFYGCTALKVCALPDTVRSIGNDAFYQCRRLKLVRMPSEAEVTQMPSEAEHMQMPSGAEIKQMLSGAEVVQMPAALEWVGARAFQGCAGLTEAVFGPALKALGERAFQGCDGLVRADMSLAEGLEMIPERCFFGCGSLKELKLPGAAASKEDRTADEIKTVKATEAAQGAVCEKETQRKARPQPGEASGGSSTRRSKAASALIV